MCRRGPMTSLLHRSTLQASLDERRGLCGAPTSTRQAARLRSAEGKRRSSSPRVPRDAKSCSHAAKRLSVEAYAPVNGRPSRENHLSDGIQAQSLPVGKEDDTESPSTDDGNLNGKVPTAQSPHGRPGNVLQGPKKQRAIRQIRETGIIACLNTSE